ncbi:hypothetical protein [Pseudomonas putida]|nr:hypothetical protein [Pseudomonas putida]HDS0989981.1 hypothetical protein [Pseudomonas putida]
MTIGESSDRAGGMHMAENYAYSAAGHDLDIYQERSHGQRVPLAHGTSDSQEIKV